MNVLIVDDSPPNLRVLRRMLEAERFSVFEAADGLQALEVLEHQEIDAVISDILMPNMDGYRLCDKVRRNPQFCQLPFILYSSTYNAPSDEEMALDLGADKYLRKPATTREILGALADIRHRGPRTQVQSAAPQQELNLVKLYNENLVRKLEDKNSELSAQKEALRASEEKFRQLAESIKEVSWMAGADLKTILYISPAYEKVWGRPCKSLYDNPGSYVESIHPEDRERVATALAGLQRGAQYDLEYRVVRPDGQTRWVHDRGSAVCNRAGEIYRVLGIAEDITDHKASEDQLRQSQKMDAIGRLAGGVAHDFNNLLTIINANVEMLLWREKNIATESMDYLNDITKATERAATLNRQLLTFSRQEAMKVQVVNLNDVIANFTKMLSRIVGEDVQVQSHFAPSLPCIKADSGMVEQVLMNLVVNARDAMPKGGTLIISTKLEVVDKQRAGRQPRAREGRFACLSVKDSGTGIDPLNLPRIFEPFFTTKGIGKGTGLGLATVYGIVEQHNGWLEVESQLGAGTVFHAFLPVSTETAPAPSQTTILKAGSGTETILLVEDEKALRDLIVRILGSRGYTVFEADNGVSAQEVWRQHASEIDLVVTDMVMPGGITGLDLADSLREQNPGIKIIVTSGYSPQLIGKNSVAERGLPFLEKPFSSQALTETVRKCLDGPKR